MKKLLLLALGSVGILCVSAQERANFVMPLEAQPAPVAMPTLRQFNYGAILGLQKGASTALELGYEMHWRKIALKKPRIWGATANLEYSFSNNIIGYKAGVWRKQGRINLTYGANLAYFSDFKGGQQFGIGPAVGFRLLGLHLVNGFNLLAGDMNRTKRGEPVGANTLYISLRYYFPTKNKFVWDRKEKRSGLFGKKEEERRGLFGRKKEKERKGLFRRRNTEEKEEKGLRRLFRLRQQQEE